MKFKHCFQRAAAVTMACLMLLCMSGTALAAESETSTKVGYKQLTQEQMNDKYSISLTYQTTNGDNSQPLPQTEFRLYKVADMNENIQFTPTEAFAGYPVFTPEDKEFVKINELNEGQWTALATTLSGYVNQDTTSGSLTPDKTIKTDAEGKGSVDGLSVGLYLILGAQSSVGSTQYTPTPVLVALPSWIDNDWEFDLASNVKFEEHTPSSPGGNNTVTRRAMKVWDDDGHEDARPSSVTVNLLCDGKVYDSKTLSASNNWRAEWTNLSSRYQWELTEAAVSDDYVVSIEREGVTFVVTNTYAEDIEDPDTPLAPGPDDPKNPDDPDVDIGDPDVPLGPGEFPDPGDPDIDLETDIPDENPPLADLPQTGQLWWPVPVLAVAGAAMILVGTVRRRNGDM